MSRVSQSDSAGRVPETVSARMKRVPRENTAPELIIRSKLHKTGFRFRLHARHLPGTPDIVLPRHKLAIFVNGCFWHGHHCNRGKRPQSNQRYWNAKIDKTISRDKRNAKELRELGWRPVTVWTCELDKDADNVVDYLREKIKMQNLDK